MDSAAKKSAQIGFDNAVDILSQWIFKKFGAKTLETPKSVDNSRKTSTPIKKGRAEQTKNENEAKKDAKNKLDEVTFDDYVAVDEDIEIIDQNDQVANAHKTKNESYQDNLKDSGFDSPSRSVVQDKFWRFRRPSKNPTFISDDPDERADIDDPRWEEIKILRNDRERKQYAMRAFGNVEPADPTRCLSYFGFLRKQIAKEKNIGQICH